MALIVKAGNRDARELAVRVNAWLEEKGIRVWRAEHSNEESCCEAMPSVDLALTLGGDGTFVSVARHTLGRDIPLAGINFGRVGFLAEFSPDSWEEKLEPLIRQGTRVAPRMSLLFSLHRSGEAIRSGEAVNDVVLTRGTLARLVNLELSVNHRPFLALRSDGLILSTPTGASGYACSAGGPLVCPSLNAYVVAAICPYLSNFPPMILNADTPFSVTVGEAGTDMHLTLDGQEAFPLQVGDIIEVRGLPGRFLTVEASPHDYFDRLLRSGFVQGSTSTRLGPGTFRENR